MVVAGDEASTAGDVSGLVDDAGLELEEGGMGLGWPWRWAWAWAWA